MTKCKLCLIRLKLSLPIMFDIDGGNFTVDLDGNLNNHRSRDEEKQTCRKQGKKDICEDSPFWGNREQIDVYK